MCPEVGTQRLCLAVRTGPADRTNDVKMDSFSRLILSSGVLVYAEVETSEGLSCDILLLHSRLSSILLAVLHH